MSTIRTSNFGPLTGNTASVVDPSTPTNGIARVGTLVSFASVASTSGTSIDFIGIPSWARRVTVMLQGVSTNGTSLLRFQLGAGSITSSGYVGACSYVGATVGTATSTSGFDSNGDSSANNLRSGSLCFVLVGSNTWAMTGSYNVGTSSLFQFLFSGHVPLSGTLDRVRITTVNGTDTFDAGTINVMYE